MPIKITDTIKKLLIVYAVVFIVQQAVDQFMGGHFKMWFALIPVEILSGKIWQIFTYSFLHSDVMHLVLNLMILAFVGGEIEAMWGRRKFLAFYFFCTTMAGLVYLIIQLAMWNPMYLSLPMVGASGGMYGLLVAYAVIFSERELLFMMMFPMKARQFIMILAGVEFLQALFSGQGGLGAFAHLSGMGAGLLFLWLQARGIQMRKNGGGSKKKNQSHLRLVKTQRPEDEDDDGPTTWH
ncbi:MAG: rhomboid family intramembrane serine protease [Bdellovibrionales bacterium]|nr:rhomboid family intramembrane serine protease [Bdellovibrionales bacterium]